MARRKDRAKEGNLTAPLPAFSLLAPWDGDDALPASYPISAASERESKKLCFCCFYSCRQFLGCHGVPKSHDRRPRPGQRAHRSTPKLPSLEFHPGWALSPIHLDCARTRSRISDQVRMISDLRTEACRAPRRAMPPRGRAAPRPLAHGGPGHSLAGGCLFAIFKLSAGGLACPGCLLVCHLCSALLCSAFLSSVGIGEERGPGDIGIGTGMVGGD